MVNEPGISIVIPTRNRIESLARTLRSVARSATSHADWEVVVIAHNCTDGTEQALQQSFPTLPMRVISHQGVSLSSAKNRALDDLHERYRERLIVMTDDDVSVAHDWLEQMRSAARRWGSRYLFGGPIEPVFPIRDSLVEGLMRYNGLASPLFAAKRVANAERTTGQEPFGPNMAFWLSASRGIRFNPEFGPPECLGEETIFLRDMAEGGRRYVHVPSARVRHHLRPEQLTTEWLERRIRMWGITKARFLIRDRGNPDSDRRIRRLGRRAEIRRFRYQIAERMPGLHSLVRLRLHLRSLQSEALRDECLRLMASPSDGLLELGKRLSARADESLMIGDSL
jgi:glycosyltransferase involved in cell wall biosynthesis